MNLAKLIYASQNIVENTYKIRTISLGYKKKLNKKKTDNLVLTLSNEYEK